MPLSTETNLVVESNRKSPYIRWNSRPYCRLNLTVTNNNNNNIMCNTVLADDFSASLNSFLSAFIYLFFRERKVYIFVLICRIILLLHPYPSYSSSSFIFCYVGAKLRTLRSQPPRIFASAINGYNSSVVEFDYPITQRLPFQPSNNNVLTSLWLILYFFCIIRFDFSLFKYV